MISAKLKSIKKNMLSWYPFDSQDRCLIVGDPEEVLKDALSTKVRIVIRVDELSEYAHDETFDIVILYGTLSRTILGEIKRKLTARGKILLWADNRIGLRYMSGMMDQNTKRYFSGFSDYVDGADETRGYTRQELCRMIEQAGYSDYKFYYPYPDEAFVKEIFTDTTLTEFEYGKEYYNFFPGTMALFSEAWMTKSLREEGVLQHFANCFWVEISLQHTFASLIYGKINSFRKEEFQIITLIQEKNGERFVEKRGLTPKAELHVKKMLNHSNPLHVKACRDGITSRYYTSDNLNTIVERHIKNGRADCVLDAIRKAYQVFFEQARKSDYLTSDFYCVFGEEKTVSDEIRELKTICPANIDMICDNIFLEGEEYHLIDTEWVFDFDIPILFILWRCIRELYAIHMELKHLISYDEFLRHFDISLEMDHVFYRWTMHFVGEYVGTGIYEKEAIPRIPVDMLSVYTNNGNAAESKVFYDRGGGYTEEDSCLALLQTDSAGRFSLTFPVPEGVHQIRWTPVRERDCNCNILETNCRVISHNGSECEMGQIFDNGDPWYMLAPPTDGSGELRIRGEISIDTYMDTCKKVRERICVLESDLESAHKEKEILQAEYDKIINSRSWKVMSLIKRILKR